MAKTPSTAKDRNAIRKIQKDFDKAWAKGDPKAMAADWADDGDMLNPFGIEAQGRSGVEKLFTGERATFAQGSKIATGVRSIRFIKPDVALVNCTFEVTDAHGPDGSNLPPLKGHYTDLMTRTKGKWQIAACRVMVPAQPPA